MRFALMAVLTGLLLALCLWTVATHAPRIEAGVSQAASQALAAAGNVAVLVDGRDVTVIGRVHRGYADAAVQSAIGDLEQSLSGLSSVRQVDSRFDLVMAPAPSASPERSDRDLTALEWDFFLGVL
ncbi:MAG: hypothetical protein QNJ40_11085 [Xanthomonadales bacterium]|nr:hypothetical protein [Xanthomonadales bacterium]